MLHGHTCLHLYAYLNTRICRCNINAIYITRVLHICKTLTYAHMYTTFHTCMLTCMYTHTCHMTTCPHQFMFTYMFMHKHHVYVQIQAIRAPTHTCKEYTSTPSHKHIHIQGSASKCEASLTLRPPSRWQCSFYKITSTKRDSQ